MLRFLPVGWIGLMLGGLVAANSSTILTHLNWGASYLVHDFYRRFVNRATREKHYVMAGRLATVLLFVALFGHWCSLLDTATGQLQHDLCKWAPAPACSICVRWFWWRVTAWCEIVAMVSSFVVSIVLLILAKNGVDIPCSQDC